MHRTLIIAVATLAFVAGLFVASTLASAPAAGKPDDANALKFPYAGKELNEPVTMTRLEYLIAMANAKPINAVVQHRHKCDPVMLVDTKAKATPKGLILAAKVKGRFKKGDCEVMCSTIAGKWSRRHEGFAEAKNRWPMAVQLYVGDKKVHTQIRKGW